VGSGNVLVWPRPRKSISLLITITRGKEQAYALRQHACQLNESSLQRNVMQLARDRTFWLQSAETHTEFTDDVQASR
jgi:hypothetical protein